MNISQDLEKLLKSLQKRGEKIEERRKMKTFIFSSWTWMSLSSSSSTCVIMMLLIFILNVSFPSQNGGVLAASLSQSSDIHQLAKSGDLNKNSLQIKTSDVTMTDSPGGGESNEEGQYYDDDAGVTFITDDEIYDDITHSQSSSPSSQHHGIYQNRKHVEDERCPPHLQEPALSTTRLCEATRCQRDSDCRSGDGSLICCYNGCIHSCLPRVDPPLAFDWLEETELKMFRNGSEDMLNLPSSPSPSGGRALSPKILMNADSTPETIALVGGCTITPIQYEDLRLFRKHEHVTTCTCLKGDVVCEVNVDKTRLPSSTPISTSTSGFIQESTTSSYYKS